MDGFYRYYASGQQQSEQAIHARAVRDLQKLSGHGLLDGREGAETAR